MRFKVNIYLIPPAICFLYFFLGFWLIPLFPPDEPKYTFAAMKMIETGDYLTPYFNCLLRLEKPIFTYWAIAGSYKIFGISDWAARIPTILFMSLLVFYLFIVVKKEFNQKVGIYFILFFATNLQIYIYSKAIVPEPYLLVFNTLSSFSMYYGIRNENKNQIIVAYLFSAFAFLTKGPLGILIPFGINIPYFFIKKGLKDTLKLAVNPIGIFIFLLINLPWYGMMIKIHGMTFINEFFIVHNIKRFSGGAAMHLYPFYYYIPVILISTFFWIGYLPNLIKYLFSPKFTDMEKFLVWWAFFVFLFFSFSKNKLHHYIIIIHPALSILMATGFYKLNGKKCLSNVILSCLFILELAFLLFGTKIYDPFDYNLTPVLIFLPLSVALLLISNNLFKKEFTLVINAFIFLIITFFLMSYGNFIREKTMPQYDIIKKASLSKKLIAYKRNSEDINFYTTLCTEKINSKEELNSLLSQKTPFLLIVHERLIKELSSYKYKIIAKTTTLKNINWYTVEFTH